MSRSFEARLAKVELAVAPKQMSHEEHLAILDRMPPLTEAEAAEMDARIEAEAIAQFGSLAAAAVAVRAAAQRTRNPLDELLAADMECRAEERGRLALA